MSMTKEDFQKDWQQNKMRKPKVASLSLHCCVGESGVINSGNSDSSVSSFLRS